MNEKMLWLRLLSLYYAIFINKLNWVVSEKIRTLPTEEICDVRRGGGGRKIYFGRPKGAGGKWGYNLSKGLKLLCFYKKSFPDLEEPSPWLRVSDGVMQHAEFIASKAERLYNNSDHLLVLKKWIFVCPLPHRPSYDSECCTRVQCSRWISSHFKSNSAKFYFLKVNW